MGQILFGYRRYRHSGFNGGLSVRRYILSLRDIRLFKPISPDTFARHVGAALAAIRITHGPDGSRTPTRSQSKFGNQFLL